MDELFKRWKLLSSIFFIVVIIAYILFNQEYDLGFFVGMLFFFIYYLITLGFLFRMEFISKLIRLAEKLNFKKDLHLIRTPKLYGRYKRKKFKIEYWYKTTERTPFMILTYIKLYVRSDINYAQEKLERFQRKRDVVSIKFNPIKKYLIMKIRGDITSYRKLKEWMNYLITISKKARS